MPTAAARAARTRAHVRTHQTLGVAKKPRKRLPRQARPDGIRREYARALVAMFRARVRPAFAELERELPGLLESARRARMHADGGEIRADAGEIRADAGESQRLKVLLERARNSLTASVSQHDVEVLAEEFGRRVSTFQRVQLNQQVKAALGVDVLLRDRALSDMLRGFAAENANLIVGATRQLADDVGAVVHRAVAQGALHGDIAPELEKRFGFAEDRAARIARDQVGKFNADVDQARQRELGVTRFVWESVKDERVRGDPGGLYPKAPTSHYDFDGKTYAYSDPPLNADGVPILPGDEINCRCFATPVLEDLLE